MGLFYGSQISGLRFIESEAMVDQVEDWSRVRSPSRAERRRRQGHRQNVRIVTTPKKEAVSLDGRTFYMHPVMADALRREIKSTIDRKIENALYGRH
jgi:hypothetical protein